MLRFIRIILGIAIVAAIAIVALRLTHPLPDRQAAEASTAVPASADTRLGAAILPLAAEHDGESGVLPLSDGRDALVARMLLARAAEETIDVQYYIWQTDTTGWLLLDELRAAAERGVRVRLLLDDNGIPGLDNVLAALDEMPTVEVRIFNPFTMRSPKLLSYAFDFPRLNRRMHNKSMTVDGAATVIGGRNIGDIYFAYGDGTAYFDFDVLAIGPAAQDVSSNFDLYWDSASVYPATSVLPPTDGGLEELAAAVAAAREDAGASAYLDVLASSPLVERLLARDLELEWTTVTLVSDDPAKGLGQASGDQLLVGRLPTLLSTPERSIDLVSAYLIPGEQGTQLLEGFAGDGVKTRLLTNSLEATDVAPVHSAWMKYRDDLVRAGAEVLELRARPDIPTTTSLARLLGGSASSLHAKTFAVDDERIFIGSFNFDPRSASLNTEMGFLIESSEIASALSRALDRTDTVYKVEEGADGALQWIEITNTGESITYTTEPGTSAFQRGIVRFLSWLPIEWIL